ncbi:hypothetical protein F5888DRAFT_1809354 [Russula emetica]|nr:hypothetical protein F5888DRAFT_1809354 [Russula emetica]
MTSDPINSYRTSPVQELTPVHEAYELASSQEPVTVRVGGRYRVGKLRGAGTFGTVYLGKDIKKGRDVAVKLEVALEWGSKLEHEYNIYWATSGIRGIPKMLWYGMEG